MEMFSVYCFQLKSVSPLFLRKVFFLKKIDFKVTALKTFKISNDYHIKNPDLSNGRPFLISLLPLFRRTYALYALSVGFKMKASKDGQTLSGLPTYERTFTTPRGVL